MNLIRSLRFKFIVGLTLIMLPLFMLLYYNNVYAMKVVRDKVSLTNMNHLAKNVEQMNAYYKRQIDIYIVWASETPISSPCSFSHTEVETILLPSSES